MITVDFEKAHEILVRIIGELYDVKELLDGASSDTFFALGESAGTIAKAKALIGRDIDQAKQRISD